MKHSAKYHVTNVTQRVVYGTKPTIQAVLTATRTGVMINTAYIERLNATFRSRLSCLTRRGRAIAHTQVLVRRGMWLVGGSYNFCTVHDSLREDASSGAGSKVGGADASDGGRADRPLLDAQRVLVVPSSAASLGGTKATRASTKRHREAVCRGCHMTTLYWGATQSPSAPINCIFAWRPFFRACINA